MPLAHHPTMWFAETDRNGLGQPPMALLIDHRGPAENPCLSLHPITTVSIIYQFGYKLSRCIGSTHFITELERNENRLMIFLRSRVRRRLYRKLYVGRG